MADLMLTVAEVIKHPLFSEAEIVGGQNGLTRTIRWVHILETAENAASLNGGELILATGIDLGDDSNKLIFYLKQLIERQASGLCLRLGPYVSAIPEEAIEIASSHDFPLIAFRHPVRFVDITLDLHETIVNRHLKVLMVLDEYSRDLQKLTLQGQNIAKVLMHLHETVKTEVFYTSFDGVFYSAPSLPSSQQTKVAEKITSLFANGQDVQTRGILYLDEHLPVTYQPIVAMGQILAYLAISNVKKGEDEFVGLILDYTATAIAQILLRGMFLQERSLDTESRILDDILQSRLIKEDEIRRVLGIKPTSEPCCVAMIVLPQHEYNYREDQPFAYRDLSVVFRSVASQHGFRTILLTRGQQLFMLLISMNPIKEWREQINKIMLGIENIFKTTGQRSDLRFGVSRLVQNYADIKEAFLEAKEVLELSSFVNSCFFEDLGINRIFIQLKSENSLHSFVNDYLGKLILYDNSHGTNLLSTLRTYLKHNLSKQETAEELFVHRQTLYHRLDKIEELIGAFYLSSDQRLCLELAFKAYDWLNK